MSAPLDRGDLCPEAEVFYCPVCGGCGIAGCCDPKQCKGGERCAFPRPWLFEGEPTE